MDLATMLASFAFDIVTKAEGGSIEFITDCKAHLITPLLCLTGGLE